MSKNTAVNTLTNPDDPRWQFRVHAFSPDGVLLMDTVHATEESARMEMECAVEIGRTVKLFRREEIRPNMATWTPGWHPEIKWNEVV